MDEGSSIAMVQLETTGHSSEIQNMSKTVLRFHF